jgi:hypothetical protein
MVTFPDSYLVRVPPDWREIPADDAELRRYQREMLDGFRVQEGWTRTAERRTEILFAQLRTLLRDAKVTYCALFAGLAAEDEASVPDLLLAGLAVSTVTTSDLDTDVPLTPDTILAAYSMDRESQVSTTNVEAPSVVVLDEAGRAVRLVRLVDLGRVDGEAVQVFSETFMVPVADGEGVCVLQFTTPNLDDAPLFSSLFGAIASTMRVLYEGTPTLPESVGLS